MARIVVNKSLRLIYEMDGKKRTFAIRSFNSDATDDGINTFKSAIESVSDLVFNDVQVTTVESVQ